MVLSIACIRRIFGTTPVPPSQAADAIPTEHATKVGQPYLGNELHAVHLVDQYHPVRSTEGMQLLRDGLAEALRATTHFPTNRNLLGAMNEEVGEFTKAILDFSVGKGPQSDIRKEAVQAIAMILRVYVEGDASIRYTGYNRRTY